MADTSFAFTDPRAQKKWASDTFDDAINLMRLGPLLGTGPEDIIRVNQDLTRQPGGDVVFECDDNLAGAGVGDDGDTTSSAQRLTVKNQTVRVHTRATRTQAAGMQSLQLTSMKGTEKFRQKSKAALSPWQAEVQELDILTSLYGGYNENASSSDIETVNEVYPDATRHLMLGQSIGSTPALGNSGTSFTTDALLSAATQTDNLFGTLVLGRARRMAVMASPRMRPGRFRQIPAGTERSVQFPVDQRGQGKLIGDFFVCLASPYQIESLVSEIGTQGWGVLQQAAAQKGNDNPVFTGGSSLYRGSIIVEWERIPYRTGADGVTLAEGFLLNAGRTATSDPVANGYTVARALFLGANAGLFAWAMPFGWWEDYYDANKPIVKTEGIYGVKVNQWNAHGTTSANAAVSRICIDTHVIV